MTRITRTTRTAKIEKPFYAGASGDVALGALISGEGPGIDVTTGGAIGLGGDTILLYDCGGAPVAEYAFSSAGLSAALAAADSGDIVWIPAGTITAGGGYEAGDVLSSGTVSGLSQSGVTVSGLTPGQWYAIEATDGPYYLDAILAESYAFQVDNGTGYTPGIGIGYHEAFGGAFYSTLPSWGAHIDNLDGQHARLFWQATTTSIGFRPVDTNGQFGNNSGTLGWALRSATYTPGISVPAGVEVVGAGENTVINASVENSGVLTNIKVTGSIDGGAARMVSNPEAQVFSRVIRSTVETNTAPLEIASTTLVTNLNADLLDGYHASDFALVGGGGNIYPFLLGGSLSSIAGSVTVTDDALHNGFPGITETTGGTLLLVYRAAATHAPSKGVIIQKTSGDGGATWSAGGTIASHATNDVREPQVTRLVSGDIALVYSQYSASATYLAGDQVYISKSSDNGGTWGTAVNIPTDFTDYSYTSAPVVELPNGDLILPVYGEDTGDSYFSTRVVRSTDGGDTWANIAVVGDGQADSRHYSEPNIVLLTNGNLLCLMRSDTPNQNAGQFYAAWSTNGGDTWTAPAAVMNATGRPHVIRLTNGMLLCIYRNRTDYQTDYQISRTNGVSWESAVQLWGTSAVRMAYAAAVEYQDGLIGVAIGDEDADDNSNIVFVRLYTTLGAGVLESNVPTGTAPLVVNSTTLVDNLNADLLDGHHWSEIPDELDELSDVDTTGTGTGDIIYNTGSGWADYPLKIGTGVTTNSNKIRFGNPGGGHYIEIDLTNGNLRLYGNATQWDDLRIAGSNVRLGATAPTLATFGPSGNLRTLRFDAGQNDEVFFEIQMPHAWKEGSRIYPHVHWAPVSATAGNVVWTLEYSWANINEAFGAPSTMNTDATAAGGTAWVHKITAFKDGSANAYIDGTGKTLSSMIAFRLSRNAGAGSDTLAADVAFLEFDIHYEVDSFGSDLEYVKDSTEALLLEGGDYLLLESGDNLLLE